MRASISKKASAKSAHLATEKDFKPAWWCRNPHVQTLWSTLFRYGPRLRLRRERLELPDGDFIDLDWSNNTQGPIVVILHGLEGSSGSPYARGMIQALHKHHLRSVVMHFRGCSGEPNRLARSYHSGDTGDLAFLIEQLRRREPHTPIAVIGYSLGGNALLKWLGETGNQSPLSAAVAVSVPFVLDEAARRLDSGFSRLYQWKLLRSLRRSVRRKFRRVASPFPINGLRKLRSFYQFDDSITAPLHGFSSADHYYHDASSRAYLKGIHTPTLIVHAADDPFMSPVVIPRQTELSPAIEFSLQAHGGHVGFIGGRAPWRVHYWLEERVPAYLQQHLLASRTQH